MMKRSQSLDHLIQEEENLHRLFDTLEESEWLEKAIPIYRQLVRAAPEESRYQQQLMQCLLSYGGDLKIRLGNFLEAERVFQELVKLDRNHVLGFYRLGFLAFYQQRWGKAATRFRKALKRRPSRTPALTEEQRMKALLYLGKSYQNLLRDSMNQFEREFERVEDRNLIERLEELYFSFKQEVIVEEEKPYVVITAEGRQYLNREECEEIQERLKNPPPNVLYLDLLAYGDQCECTTSLYRKVLTRKRAKFLHTLIENKHRLIPYEELYPVLGIAPLESSLRTYAYRLGDSIQPCFMENRDQLIARRNGGFQWTWSGDYYIFYRRDELEMQELGV